MASKRRNMFHKNKTQETTEKEPSVRQKRDTVDKGEVLGPYTPRHDFNAMDCTDMVIGTARGMTFRIWDYYTRDRSTPRVDTFWGGKNDLTAAMGFEKDGVTTILFRKKLIATEPTDHSIENAMMHIIWARGQEIGNYVHVPMSGLESETASVNDFYRPDELKYHGHKDQRGMTAINFFEQSPLTGQESGLSGMPLLNCRGQWLYPKDCNADEGKCEYVAKWQFDARTDNIHFTISTTNINLWTGIGFSNNRKMAQTDAVIGWIAKSGRPFIMDTWIVGQTAPLIDPSQNIYNVTGSSDEGVTTLTFTRKRNTGDSRVKNREKSDIVAKLLLELDDEQTKKNLQKGREEDLKKVFEDCIASGKIGSLTVDPGYLIFELMKSSQKPQETEDKNKTALISLTKLWIVIGCIAALIVVAIMQAGCTMCKVKNSASTVHKNSAWKDYSAANSNYAFEAFESEEKHPGSLGQTNGSSLSSRPAQKPINSHPMLNYQGNGNRFADTRSLQRPKACLSLRQACAPKRLRCFTATSPHAVQLEGCPVDRPPGPG
ncbi:hypothetical protein AAG570_012628 [Ranatra chinensis]|uniref:DOMON domain-containing protein n=1 Tax=Ranatra chinensis TaxID=642074 RepID=A0ABD0Z0M7_9HEMI